MSPTEAPSRIAGGVSGAKGGSTQGKGAAEGENGGGKKKSKKMKLAVLVLVLLLAIVGAKETVLKKKPVAAKAGAAAKPVPGPMIPLTEQTLNLTDGHFLRVIVVIVTTKGTSATLDVTEGNQAVIDQFSNQTETALTGLANRNKARKQLVARLEKLYPKKIEDVTFNEFVMQ